MTRFGKNARRPRPSGLALPVMRLFTLLSLFCVVSLARAELVFEKPIQTFHAVPADGHVEARFSFKNSGPEPVEIRKVRSSCGCTSARLEKKLFAPGEGSELVARFSFGGRRGPQRKLITVTTRDKREHILDLRVWIHEPLTISPPLVYWKVGEPAVAKQVGLIPAKGQKVGIKSVVSSNPRLSATLAPGGTGDASAVIVKPVDTTQKESAEVTVQTDSPPDAPRSYTIHARVK